MKITGFLIMNGDGEEILSDAHGNNVAINCENCGHPLLLIALKNQRGSDEAHPAKCTSCGTRYFLDVRPSMEKLYIFDLDKLEAMDTP